MADTLSPERHASRTVFSMHRSLASLADTLSPERHASRELHCPVVEQAQKADTLSPERHASRGHPTTRYFRVVAGRFARGSVDTTNQHKNGHQRALYIGPELSSVDTLRRPSASPQPHPLEREPKLPSTASLAKCFARSCRPL